jgi:hypothetical protein
MAMVWHFHTYNFLYPSPFAIFFPLIFNFFSFLSNDQEKETRRCGSVVEGARKARLCQEY